MNTDNAVHVRLRRVGTIFSSHDGPGDISTVAVMAMVGYGQRGVRIRGVDDRAPGLAVKKEGEVDNGQGWTLSGLLVAANDVQLDEVGVTMVTRSHAIPG